MRVEPNRKSLLDLGLAERGNVAMRGYPERVVRAPFVGVLWHRQEASGDETNVAIWGSNESSKKNSSRFDRKPRESA